MATKESTEASGTNLMQLYEANQSGGIAIVKDKESLEEIPVMMEKDGELVPTSSTALPSKFSLDTYLDLVEKSKKLSTSQVVVQVSAIYKEFAPNETVRGIFSGIRTINFRNEDGEIKPTTTIQWIDEHQKLYENSGVILVSYFVQTDLDGNIYPIIPPYTAVEISYLGKKNRAKTYSVSILN